MRLSDTHIVKIQRFLNDEIMRDAVMFVIQESFLKSRTQKEVHYLAAKSLSLEFLEEARRDLEKYRNHGKEDGQTGKTQHV